MSQTISQNLTVNGNISSNALTTTTANVTNLQTSNLNVSNLQGTISSLTIPTLTSNVHVNNTSVTTPQLFIASKNIGTSIQTLEDNNVTDRQNISSLLNKTTNISYNSTTLQTSITSDTNINNILNQVKISNNVNNNNLVIKPGYSTNTVMQTGNCYVATANTSDIINVNNNMTIQGNLQTVNFKSSKIDVSGNVTSDNVIVNNVDVKNYITTNNNNITNYGNRITTLETNQNNNNLNLSGISYNSSTDTTVIDNNLEVNKYIECQNFCTNNDLIYNSTAISNPVVHGLQSGNADAFEFDGFNLGISSWQSTGFIDSCFKKCNLVINNRTGDIKSKGSLDFAGIKTYNDTLPVITLRQDADTGVGLSYPISMAFPNACLLGSVYVYRNTACRISVEVPVAYYNNVPIAYSMNRIFSGVQPIGLLLNKTNGTYTAINNSSLIFTTHSNTFSSISFTAVVANQVGTYRYYVCNIGFTVDIPLNYSDDKMYELYLDPGQNMMRCNVSQANTYTNNYSPSIAANVSGYKAPSITSSFRVNNSDQQSGYVNCNTVQTNNIVSQSGELNITSKTTIDRTKGLCFGNNIGAWIVNATSSETKFNNMYPLLCTQKKLGKVDDYFVVQPGFKLILYKDLAYAGASYTIDNTLGNIVQVRRSIDVVGIANSIDSCRLYYQNVEITFPEWSN